MPRVEFYREWVRRAFSGKLGIAQTVSGLASVSVAAAGLSASRYPAVSEWLPFTVDQATVAVFVAVFLATVVLGFILAPNGMHVEDVERAKTLTCRLNDLESSAEPSLSFAKLLSPEKFPGDPTTKLYRIPIRNGSDTRALHNVEVTVSVLHADGSSTEARTVKDTDGHSDWNLNPESIKQIDLVAVKPDKSPPRAYIAPYLPGLSPRSVIAGTYTVLLEATCRETRKMQRRFTLTLASDGALRLEEAA